MEVMRALSKTEQVANFLRDEIKKRNLPPGSRLRSSRILAAKFAASKKVVESAFGILESEGLIYKRARSGVFVNKPHPVSHLKEIYILGVGLSDSEVYFNKILKLASTDFKRSGFTFLARAYSFGIPPSTVLDMEKNRLDKMPEVDCVLISAAPLKRSDVEQCLNFGKPVIFIGDFSSHEMEDMDLNQIMTGNACQGALCVEWMKKKDVGELTLFNGSSEHLFNRLYIEGAKEKAKLLGINLNVVEFPKGVSALPDSERFETLKRIVSVALRENRISSTGVVINAVDKKMVCEVLRTLSPKLYENMLFMPECSLDFNVFREKIVDRVEELIDGETLTPQKIRMELPVTIHEQISTATRRM